MDKAAFRQAVLADLATRNLTEEQQHEALRKIARKLCIERLQLQKEALINLGSAVDAAKPLGMAAVLGPALAVGGGGYLAGRGAGMAHNVLQPFPSSEETQLQEKIDLLRRAQWQLKLRKLQRRREELGKLPVDRLR